MLIRCLEVLENWFNLIMLTMTCLIDLFSLIFCRLFNPFLQLSRLQTQEASFCSTKVRSQMERTLELFTQ